MRFRRTHDSYGPRVFFDDNFHASALLLGLTTNGSVPSESQFSSYCFRPLFHLLAEDATIPKMCFPVRNLPKS